MNNPVEESCVFALVCFLLTVSLMLICLMLIKAHADSWLWWFAPVSGMSASVVGYMAWSRLVAGRDEDRARRSVYAGCIVGVATHFVQFALWALIFFAASLFTNKSWLSEEDFSPLTLIGAVAVLGGVSMVWTGIVTIPMAVIVARIFAGIYPADKDDKQ